MRDWLMLKPRCRVCGTSSPFPWGPKRDGFGNPAPWYWRTICERCARHLYPKKAEWKFHNTIEEARNGWCRRVLIRDCCDDKFEDVCREEVFVFPVEPMFNLLVSNAVRRLVKRKERYGKLGLKQCEVRCLPANGGHQCPHWATTVIDGILHCGYHASYFRGDSARYNTATVPSRPISAK